MATLIYFLSISLSAFLLFAVQPMVAKLGLPWFGGSPQVWNTCLLFFQTLLLGGYAYAHFSSQRLGAKKQLVVHALLLLVPILVLPPAIGAALAPSPGAWPVPKLLIALAVSAGLPFFVLSTNGTLVQKWYALRSEREPYFLYAASNAGSLFALCAYPFLVEPRLGLAQQTRWFSWGYGGFVVVSLVGMAFALRGGRTHTVAASVPVVDDKPPAPERPGGPFWWATRAAVTSILLVSTSFRISTDVGAVPLLWVIPLALYLLSFIIAYVDWLPYPRIVLRVITAVLIAVTLGYPSLLNNGLVYMAVPLGLMFFGSWVLHADLARDRPHPRHLTAYYLWISLGGALGSVFCNLVAPLLWKTLAEYSVGIVLLAGLLAIPSRLSVAEARDVTKRSINWLAAGLAATVVLTWAVLSVSGASWSYFRHLPFMFLLVGMVFLRVPVAFVAVTAFVATLNLAGFRTADHVLFRDRSFFGVVKVSQQGNWRSLVHGSTNHGMQHMNPPDSPPTMYYHPQSPMGTLSAALPDNANWAVVGLGTGSLAGYSKPGQQLTYYEIDPMVEPMARKWFTYLPRAKAPVKVTLGDARLSLRQTPDASYDFMIVDAFSSDAIPVHMLTREAVDLFMHKVKPEALVLFHVSNRYLDLLPVLRGHAAALGLQGAVMHYVPDDKADDEGASATDVVVLSRSAATLAPLTGAQHWDILNVAMKRVDWTDDRSSLLGLLRFAHDD